MPEEGQWRQTVTAMALNQNPQARGVESSHHGHYGCWYYFHYYGYYYFRILNPEPRVMRAAKP